jgi:hypothetical protein
MNFRRWITALAVFALFVGLASAQVSQPGLSGGGTFNCNAAVSVPPQLRVEGFTELVGDIVLTCNGGTTPTLGVQLPTANFTISFVTAVTSRLLVQNGVTNSATAANTSEALLLIDDPGSADLPVNTLSYSSNPSVSGPTSAQTLCTVGMLGNNVASAVGAGTGGCPQYPVWDPNTGDFLMSSSSTSLSASANVYAGVVNNSQVVFNGIPIMPPASPGVARIYRITNVRINAAQLGSGLYPGTIPATVGIAISPNPGVTINQTSMTAGWVQTGLSTSLRNLTDTGGGGNVNFSQCSSASTSGVAILRYSENFATAFKTRSGVYPGVTTSNGQASTPTPPQNVPARLYNSESGLIFSSAALNGSGFTYNSVAGLADYGTRLKAVFNNIPTGVRVFVSTVNIINTSGFATNAVGFPTAIAGTSTSSFAQLVVNDTIVDGNGTVSGIPASNYIYSGSAPAIPYAEIIPVNGSATAVWEVINTNPAVSETFDFGMWITYTAATASNLPPPTGSTPATVNMNYAPSTTSTAAPTFTSSSGPVASASLTIPRFNDVSSAQTLFNIVQCTTSLLFPFITNIPGWDTGIAIMNTSQDPFGTKTQSGTCSLYFYGQNLPSPNPMVTAPIPAGNAWTPAVGAWNASVIAPNFEGYMIAWCNFQYAHGYAFISDLGAHTIAHGYLALIMSGNSSTTSRGTSLTNNAEALEN